MIFPAKGVVIFKVKNPTYGFDFWIVMEEESLKSSEKIKNLTPNCANSISWRSCGVIEGSRIAVKLPFRGILIDSKARFFFSVGPPL